LVTVAPAETSALIMVGDGVGLGVGEGVGVGVGVGVGDCAYADEATPIARKNAIAAARTRKRPPPVVPARVARHEQRMQSIPKRRRASPKNAQSNDR
jgi:hypothetical protein